MKIFAFFVVVFLIAITLIRLLLGYLPENQITFTELLSLLSDIDIEFDRTLEGIMHLTEAFKPVNLPSHIDGILDIEFLPWIAEFAYRFGTFIVSMAEITIGIVVDIVSFLSSIVRLFFGFVRSAVS